MKSQPWRSATSPRTTRGQEADRKNRLSYTDTHYKPRLKNFLLGFERELKKLREKALNNTEFTKFLPSLKLAIYT